MPLDEFEEALTGYGLPRSPVRLFTLVGALTGTASGFALTIWTALKWNLITGGKPVVSIPPFVVIAFELTILLGGLCTLLGLLVTARLPSFGSRPRYDPRFSADRFGVEVTCEPGRARGRRGPPAGRGRRGGPGMKWVFLLCLLVVGAVAGVMGGLVAYRWITSMQNDVKLVPGQITMGQPAGTVPREGAELVVAREVYATRKNPVARRRRSRWRAGRSSTTSTARRATGRVARATGWSRRGSFRAPDLTSPAVQAKPDGHFSYYIGYGGAIMPAYGEALSVTDRWDIVNHLRALAKKMSGRSGGAGAEGKSRAGAGGLVALGAVSFARGAGRRRRHARLGASSS